MVEQALSRHDLEAKIVKHSWEDGAFRKEFIADPTAVFVKYLKVPAASLPKVFIHQEEPGSWHIVLPAKPANSGELSEGELEKVAGGITDPIQLTIIPAVSGGQVGISTGPPPASQTPPFWYPEQQGW